MFLTENEIVLMLLKHFTSKVLRAAGKISKVPVNQLQRYKGPGKRKFSLEEKKTKKQVLAILEGYSKFCFLTMHHMTLLTKRKNDWLAFWPLSIVLHVKWFCVNKTFSWKKKNPEYEQLNTVVGNKYLFRFH